MFKRKKS